MHTGALPHLAVQLFPSFVVVLILRVLRQNKWPIDASVVLVRKGKTHRQGVFVHSVDIVIRNVLLHVPIIVWLLLYRHWLLLYRRKLR
jgi:hypothetical protein